MPSSVGSSASVLCRTRATRKVENYGYISLRRSAAIDRCAPLAPLYGVISYLVMLLTLRINKVA